MSTQPAKLIVVDIGNSRIKWGLSVAGQLTETKFFEHYDEAGFTSQYEQWRCDQATLFRLASVVPNATEELTQWLKKKKSRVEQLTHSLVYEQFQWQGLVSQVREKEKIGIDRLLLVIAAWRKYRLNNEQKQPIVIISIGTAMTVDFVSQEGNHLGGVILPGAKIMAQSLNQFTAKLPFVDPLNRQPEQFFSEQFFGQDTQSAIQIGIAKAIQGSADLLVRQFAKQMQTQQPPIVLITGGDATLLNRFEFSTPDVKPIFIEYLTLQGMCW